jgi:hypothetical protein
MNNSALYTNRDLEVRTAEILTKAREERFFLEDGKLVSFSDDFPMGAKTYTYRVMDVLGRASIIANGVLKSEDMNLFVHERFVPIQYLWQEFTFPFMDELHAGFAGLDMRGAQLEAAAQFIYNAIEEVGWIGAPGTNTIGFSTHQNVNILTLAPDGVGPNPTRISSKSPQQMLRDLNIIAGTTQRISKRAFVADTLLLTQDVWDTITGTYLNIGTNSQTVYAAFLENQRLQNGIKQVEIIPQLESAGSGGLPLVIAYKKSPKVLHYVRSRGITRRPYFQNVQGVTSGILANTGGVVAKQGVGITYCLNA